MITSFAEAVCESVRKDGVKLAGFGTFASAKARHVLAATRKQAKKSKSPRWVPTFKAGSLLKEAAEKKKNS